MRKPTFSIIIPTLNEEKFLPKLLDSLSRQTNKDFEAVVVDGASRDKTVQAAHQFMRKIPRLTVDIVKKPGLPVQRNRGDRGRIARFPPRYRCMKPARPLGWCTQALSQARWCTNPTGERGTVDGIGA